MLPAASTKSTCACSKRSIRESGTKSVRSRRRVPALGGWAALTSACSSRGRLSARLTSQRYWNRPEWVVRTRDRKSTRLNSSHGYISYAVFCLKKKRNHRTEQNVTLSKNNAYVHSLLMQSILLWGADVTHLKSRQDAQYSW